MALAIIQRAGQARGVSQPSDTWRRNRRRSGRTRSPAQTTAGPKTPGISHVQSIVAPIAAVRITARARARHRAWGAGRRHAARAITATNPSSRAIPGSRARLRHCSGREWGFAREIWESSSGPPNRAPSAGAEPDSGRLAKARSLSPELPAPVGPTIRHIGLGLRRRRRELPDPLAGPDKDDSGRGDGKHRGEQRRTWSGVRRGCVEPIRPRRTARRRPPGWRSPPGPTSGRRLPPRRVERAARQSSSARRSRRAPPPPPHREPSPSAAATGPGKLRGGGPSPAPGHEAAPATSSARSPGSSPGSRRRRCRTARSAPSRPNGRAGRPPSRTGRPLRSSSRWVGEAARGVRDLAPAAVEHPRLKIGE